MPIGAITNLLRKPVTTSAGTVLAGSQDYSWFTWRDLLDLVHTAARKQDGLFTVAASAEDAGGFTLTVTTNAGVVTIGPFPFSGDAVRDMLDYQAREGRHVDGL